jgi:hypothetical protein
LKHKVSTIVRDLDNFILLFKDVSRQEDFSRIDPKETRVMSAAHAEGVPIHFDWRRSIFSGFLIHELCADRAKAIDIELFQVCGKYAATFRPGRRGERMDSRVRTGRLGGCSTSNQPVP